MPKKLTSKKPSSSPRVETSSKRKPTALHMKLIQLMTRKDGATMHDTWNAGFEYPAKAALRIVENQGFKTSVVKKKGELTRYFAKRAP